MKEDVNYLLHWFFDPNNSSKYTKPGITSGKRLIDLYLEAAEHVNKKYRGTDVLKKGWTPKTVKNKKLLMSSRNGSVKA